MQFKKLNDGNEIPMLGLGTWQQTDKETCIKAIKTALQIGYKHIDTADIYANHSYIKEGIKGFNRDSLYITTKLWKDFLDPKNLEKQCDKCLKELGLDFLDLFLIHWPVRKKPLAEISYKMSLLKEKGKIKSFGVSNYTINHLKDFLDQGIKVAMNQVEFHPFLNQKDLLDFCNTQNIAITAYCPLARKKVFEDIDMKALALKYSKTPGQIALKWLLQKGIVAVPKASSEKHLKENFDIFDFEITKEDLLKIEAISKIRSQRLIEPDFADFSY